MLASTQTLQVFLRTALIILVSGSLMAFWAPYGTSRLGMPMVWLYWTGTMVLGWTFGLATEALLARQQPRGSLILRYGLVALAASIPIIIATIIFNAMRGTPVRGLTGYASVTAEVTVLTVVIVAAYGGLRWRGAPGLTASGEAPRHEIGATLLDRLPSAHKSATLLALMAEDHYLRVFTASGDVLIRMRLSDALKAVDGIDGAQTHRSWWVARGAVSSVEREEGRPVLVLSNALRAPVSRSRIAALREAGWF